MNAIQKQFSPDDRTVFLHIGYFKTGSTALQQFFAINRKAMARHGIFYPQRNKEDFVVPFLHGHPGYAEGGEKDAYEELREQALSYKFTIVSNENFSFLHRDQQKTAIRTVYRYLSRIGEVKVVFYVRRQDELMQSYYIYCVMWEKMTTLKTNYFEENPEKIINEWAAIFGPENIIVRPYEKQQNAPDIFHDFFRAVGLPFSKEYELPAKPANIRIPDKFVEIKRNINLLFPDKAVQNQFLEIIQEMAKKLPEEDVYAAHGYLSPKKRLDVLERSAAWNASIAEKYLCRSDGRLFYDPLPDSNEHWRPFGGLEAGEAISLTASIFARFIEKTEASTHKNIARLEHASKQMKQPEATPRAEIAELQRSIDSYAERMHQQALRSSEQAACLQALYNSYSWKLTAPLRAIAGFFKRSKNPSLF